ncbi:hypothetical protein E4U42_004065 [Claviceps africana]|uniref:ML-like domain-containing protein n=1 Tax=Claviceps africana TaxID=83212 RepID=A0A8K0NGE3_9HYPO|nr:hypothetical protein E4U42_004065 [Claviceps africana]
MARTAKTSWRGWRMTTGMAFLGLMVAQVMGDQVLRTNGFSDCGSDRSINMDKINIVYNNEKKTVSFDLAGSSTKERNVTAVLNVSAYGNTVYSNSFNPCDKATYFERLCPVPVGTFGARGSQQIPAKYADMVPSIAFQVPDIAAHATLQLFTLETKDMVGCFQSDVSNGKTADVSAVSYIAVSIAGAALLMSGISALGAALSGGSAAGSSTAVASASPTFSEVMGWFQGMAMNSMLSVNYPQLYRSFANNFVFSAGMIPWSGMQKAIDSFRAHTGGDLTQDSYSYLQKATLVFPDGSTRSPNQGLINVKRAVDAFVDLAAREVQASINSTDTKPSGESGTSSLQHKVQGIQASAEQLLVPKSNVFIMALLIVAIIIASIVLGVLLIKVVLEIWALFGNFPEGLKGFRKHYWGSMARTITSLIMLLYGIWVLYCVFQFTRGDSPLAKALAGVTLALFTGVLAFFTWKIWSVVRELKKREGSVRAMYEDKSIWVKYSLFYDAYRKEYWWLFVPAILYMFAKGVAIAAGDGHGMAQTISQLVIESLMLCLLLWSRPFERRSSNIINIMIQTVRFLSIGCIMVFVEEFGVKQTTKTITGVVLIAIQSTLTAILAILIVWNALTVFCTMNPHRKRRKEAEKYRRDMDTLTPLDARNSLFLDRTPMPEKSMFAVSSDLNEKGDHRQESVERYYAQGGQPRAPAAPSAGPVYRPLTPSSMDSDSQSLLEGAAPLGTAKQRPPVPGAEREYRGTYGPVPNLGSGHGNGHGHGGAVGGAF